jgi:anhydro-N-acetylmuramic acid kinase
MLLIGLISGTSVDAIDAALVDITREGDELSMALRAFTMQPFDTALRERVRALLPPNQGSTAEVCEVNALLGEAFAQAAGAVARQAGMELHTVDLIASHGQTVYHQVAPGAARSTLQLGAPAIVAERAGCTVAADFRTRDMAAGGEGAPLVPYLDTLLFADPHISRAVQNIGGIGNVTYLPATEEPRTENQEPGSGEPRTKNQEPRADQVSSNVSSELAFIVHRSSFIAFDSGPGNVLIDEAVRALTGGAATFDHDGRMAAAGQVDEVLLAEWLRHPYFHRPPPKSTGREQWGPDEAERYLAAAQARGLSPADAVATLTALTAWSIAHAYGAYLGRVDEVLVGGGGARNPALLRMIRQALPQAHVRAVDDLGLSADAKEAVAFALIGYATLHGWPGNVPAATGAEHSAVLGSITPGANYRALLRDVLAAPDDPPRRLRLR